MLLVTLGDVAEGREVDIDALTLHHLDGCSWLLRACSVGVQRNREGSRDISVEWRGRDVDRGRKRSVGVSEVVGARAHYSRRAHVQISCFVCPACNCKRLELIAFRVTYRLSPLLER